MVGGQGAESLSIVGCWLGRTKIIDENVSVYKPVVKVHAESDVHNLAVVISVLILPSNDLMIEN